MAAANDDLRLVKDALRTCPGCQSQDTTDCKVTRSRPASSDASRAELP
jgi:hypothetical protein